eukprot:jgi/Chlat1/1717/Chrsp127S01940
MRMANAMASPAMQATFTAQPRISAARAAGGNRHSAAGRSQHAFRQAAGLQGARRTPSLSLSSSPSAPASLRRSLQTSSRRRPLLPPPLATAAPTTAEAEEQQQEQQESPSSMQSEVEEVGKVDKIVATRITEDEGRVEYLIKWEDDHPDSWEPAENIAPNVIDAFEEAWWPVSKQGDFSALQERLSEGRLVDKRDANGRTALHYASGIGSKDCVRALLDAGADVSVQDKDGYTPLHIAAGYVHTGAVTELLAAGADPELADVAGRSALDLAQGLLDRLPKDNPLQFAKRMALAEVVRLLDEAVFEEVEVTAILDKRVGEEEGEKKEGDNSKTEVEYLVRWSDGSEDSWEPASSIDEAIIRDFEDGLEYGEVAKVLNKRIDGDTVEYLVQWTDDAEDSWEDAANIAPEAIAEYENSANAQS